MRKYLFLIVIVFPVLFLSCDEDFNPKSEFIERYALNIIIRPDTTVQVATVYRSYNVDGYNPYENKVDPALADADIRIIHDDQIYVFKDTLKMRTDTARYNTPFRFYYCNNFKAVPNKEIKVIAQLNNGHVLRASTMLPQKLEMESGSDQIIPSADKSSFTFKWKKTDEGLWYLPKLRLLYKTRAGQNYYPHYKEVYLMDKTGDTYSKPYSPYITRSNAITFERASLDSAMASIRRDNPDYNDIFFIYGCTLEILVFDKNLSGYYSSIHGYLDNLSVRLDGSDFSNVEGGFGVLGSYIKGNLGAAISDDYIRLWGYSIGRK